MDSDTFFTCDQCGGGMIVQSFPEKDLQSYTTDGTNTSRYSNIKYASTSAPAETVPHTEIPTPSGFGNHSDDGMMNENIPKIKDFKCSRCGNTIQRLIK